MVINPTFYAIPIPQSTSSGLNCKIEIFKHINHRVALLLLRIESCLQRENAGVEVELCGLKQPPPKEAKKNKNSCGMYETRNICLIDQHDQVFADF